VRGLLSGAANHFRKGLEIFALRAFRDGFPVCQIPAFTSFPAPDMSAAIQKARKNKNPAEPPAALCRIL